MRILDRTTLLSLLLACALGCDQIKQELNGGGIYPSDRSADVAALDRSPVDNATSSGDRTEVSSTVSAEEVPSQPYPSGGQEELQPNQPKEVTSETSSAASHDSETTTMESQNLESRQAEEAETRQERASAAIPPLRYSWELGRKYPYSVQIDVKYADLTETLRGTPVYTVKASDSLSTTLEFHGKLASSRTHDSGFPSFPDPFRYGIFSPFSGVAASRSGTDHEVVVDSLGQVKHVRGESQLPYLLGNLSLLVLDPLPEKQHRTWKTENAVTIRIRNQRSSFSRFGGFPRSRSFGPGGTSDRFLEAAETIDFRLKSVEAGKASIVKEYELKTEEMLGEHPRFCIVGRGETLFDIEQGVPLRSEFHLCVASEGQDPEAGVPVMVSYKLLTGDDYEKWLADVEAAQQGRSDAPADDAQRVLADLESGDANRIKQAAKQALNALPGDMEQGRIIELLVRQLHHPDTPTREAVVKALAQSVSEEQIPVLIEASSDESVTVRWAALDGLARFPVAAAIEAIAARMHDSSDRLAAARLLKSMGPHVEPVVLRLLSADDWRTRQAAVEVLQVVGGEASRDILTKAAEDDASEHVQSAARTAMERIQRRLDAEPLGLQNED